MKSRVLILTLTLTSVWLLTCGTAAATDGVVLIDQARALAGGVTPGDTPGFPVLISVSGSYRLSGSLTVPADTTGIITSSSAPYVTIDLNGFEIHGGGGTTGDGIQLGALGGQLTVKNGTIRSMGGNGIAVLITPTSGIVTNVQVIGNNNSGIVIQGTAVVTECVVSANDGYGIFVTSPSNAVIKGNLIRGNGTAITDAGVSISRGLLSDNTILDNVGRGAQLSGNVGYHGNVLAGNNGGDANPQVQGGTNLGGNLCGTAACAP